jgi:hypothetical protein
MVRRRFLPGVMTSWRVPVAIQVARTQGSRLTWVSSSASTAAPVGSSASWWWRWARTWSRSGSPLATSRGRRQPATSRTRRRRVQRLMAGRPSRWYSRGIVHALGWESSRRMRSVSRRLPRRGRPGRGRSASPATPCWLNRWIQRRTVEGSQPSSSAMAPAVQPRADSRIMTRRTPCRWGPYSGPRTSQGQPAAQERLAYTLRGRILAAASSGRCAVEGFSDPRGYFIHAGSCPHVVRCWCAVSDVWRRGGPRSGVAPGWGRRGGGVPPLSGRCSKCHHSLS